MEPSSTQRKLITILHADVQGYSRLIAQDDAATLHTLTPYLEMMRTLVQEHGGRAVGSRGDSLLAEFASVVGAVQESRGLVILPPARVVVFSLVQLTDISYSLCLLIMEVRYYVTPSGHSPVRRFIEQMPVSVQEDFLIAIDRLARGETLEMPLSKPLSNIASGLHELRFREARSIYRVSYFIKKKNAIYLLHAAQKKTQKLSDKDRKLILNRLKEI